jgi:alcohol oxidase
VIASKLIVVSAGAFGSPTILERSGIGAKAVLKRCGIEQLVNLPGVGENYQGVFSLIYVTTWFMLSDHNLTLVPYFAADGAVTMDPLWRGEESTIQGTHVLVMPLAPSNYSNVEHLTQWESNGKSLIAQKLELIVIAVGGVLINPSVALIQRSNGVLMRRS